MRPGEGGKAHRKGPAALQVRLKRGPPRSGGGMPGPGLGWEGQVSRHPTATATRQSGHVTDVETCSGQLRGFPRATQTGDIAEEPEPAHTRHGPAPWEAPSAAPRGPVLAACEAAGSPADAWPAKQKEDALPAPLPRRLWDPSK